MRATPAEHRFKEAVRALVRRGIHPTPVQLNMELGRDRPRERMHHLNGREVSWRHELVPGWDVHYGRAVRDATHCELFCCVQGGGFPPDDLALTCSNKHLELVRLNRVVSGRILLGSGADQCTFCDEWRDEGEVAMKLNELIRRSTPPPPPRTEPGTIRKGMIEAREVVVVGFLLVLAAFVGVVITLEHFFG